MTLGGDGSTVRIPQAGSHVLIELWGEYCPPCWQSLARRAAWYRGSQFRQRLTIVAACVDCREAAWLSRTRETGLTGIPGWSNVRLDSRTPWVRDALRGRPKANLLIDPDGTVLHWDMDTDPKLASPEVLPVILERHGIVGGWGGGK